MTKRTGYTLIELAAVLVLAGLIAGTALPTMGRARDQVAVRGARAELAAALAATRATAISAGGATLVIDVPTGTAWIQAQDGSRVHHTVHLPARYGVTLHTRTGAALALRFDGLGIGRMTNATVQLRRGSAEASFIVSAYGRLRQ
jgi:prepilin-type N-terminal cleavage/methylation domain-containing protein